VDRLPVGDFRLPADRQHVGDDEKSPAGGQGRVLGAPDSRRLAAAEAARRVARRRRPLPGRCAAVDGVDTRLGDGRAGGTVGGLRDTGRPLSLPVSPTVRIGTPPGFGRQSLAGLFGR